MCVRCLGGSGTCADKGPSSEPVRGEGGKGSSEIQSSHLSCVVAAFFHKRDSVSDQPSTF